MKEEKRDGHHKKIIIKNIHKVNLKRPERKIIINIISRFGKEQ